MGKKGKTQYVRCPMCRETIEISRDTELDDIISCYDCDGEFRVVSLKPVKLEALDDDDWERDTDDD
jgi:lysine biosynthesis protein LysW